MRKTDIMNDNTLKAKGEWAQYHVVTAKDAPPFCPVRWHEEAEALLVLEGEGALYADGVKYPLKKGDCAVILPFVMHSIAGNESFCFEAIIIDVRAAGEREEKSKIVCQLKAGAAVSLSRNDIDFLATEYGVVSLRGTNIKERVEKIISVAHPKFREELIADAKKVGLI